MMLLDTHLIHVTSDARSALKQLDSLPENQSRTLFVVDGSGSLMGTLTDGDIRRGLLEGYEISDSIRKYMNKKYRSLSSNDSNQIEKLKAFRKADINLVPVLENNCIVKILDLDRVRSAIPAAALLMAGGRGERLKPLTDTVPKPMLKVGSKPIIEHNIDRLISYGFKKIYVSVNYLRDQIKDYFGDGSSKAIEIQYVEENAPLGTIGSLSLIDKLQEEDLLVMNSDLLTNIDFEEFFLFYKEKDSLMAVASIPYTIDIPYAVLDTLDNKIIAFKEKPTYTYYSNGGIYFMKRALKDKIKVGEFYNATDLMETVINTSGIIVHYPLLEYWLDIGNYQQFAKAQEDIKHIRM